MSEKPTTAIVKVKAEDYALAKPDVARKLKVIQRNVGPAGVNIQQDLDRLVMPSGGQCIFQVPGTTDEFEKTIAGVILGYRDVRIYWGSAMGEGENKPPQCACDDIEENVGVGNPGGACQVCPFNQYQGGCDERRLLFVALPDSILPFLFNLPVMSVPNCRAYFLNRLGGAGLLYCHAVTRIGLEPASSNGHDYAKATFTLESELSPELAQTFERIADEFEPILGVIGPNRQLPNGEVVETVAEETKSGFAEDATACAR